VKRNNRNTNKANSNDFNFDNLDSLDFYFDGLKPYKRLNPGGRHHRGKKGVD